MSKDLVNELSQNFIEYAAAVNSDRAIPDSKSGLKPVARRILYGAFDGGRMSNKPHVKCARIVGDVMGNLHPHGDSSIYGALVRLAQDWVMRYPLIDFHGNVGNIGGDGPAASRYTEARLAKITEDGLLCGIKKNNVDFIPNYDETDTEPVTLPSIFPNLLCNPNTGIGVAMACSWAPHNLNEVAAAIHDYLDGKEPMLLGPDFPTGGIVLNKNDIPTIMKTGHGTIKLRAKHKIEGMNIVFTEIPFGTATEAIMESINTLIDKEELTNVKATRDESNKNGIRIVVECEGKVQYVLSQLFAKTDLQTTFSYNQVALVDKTPTELNLKDCIKIYVSHNIECIIREAKFDFEKASARLEIVEGLLRALEDIDNIIALIKKSESSAKAKDNLISVYNFTEPQAKAIVDMKLGRLAGLERIELNDEKNELISTIEDLKALISNDARQQEELLIRLDEVVKKYGDARRTELTQEAPITKEEKEIVNVEPEKCVVTMTESGLVKRIPLTSFKTQRRNGKGVRTADDIVNCTIKTNTIDSLMVFTDKGKMYRILVDELPVGNNTTKGTPIKALIDIEPNEKPTMIYSIYRDTDAKFVLFTTKNGIVKKTSLDEYIGTKKKSGVNAINLKEGDSIASVNLIKDETIILITHEGMAIRMKSMDISPSGRATQGMKGISMKDGDYVVSCLTVKHDTDYLAVFSESGLGKKFSLSELPVQGRAGKGLICYKPGPSTGKVVCGTLVDNEDNVLIIGANNSICISANDIPEIGRAGLGNQLIKGTRITSVSKV